MGFDMRSSGSNGHRHASPIRSNIFQICVGLALAVFLFQADRMISALGAEDELPPAVVSKDVFAVGIHVVKLECGYMAAVLNRVVKIGATPCHLTTIFR
ncbi:MAG: hypothetical protein WCA78_10745 [Rhizomicrobium sp.]|jgi:hypothetical protein